MRVDPAARGATALRSLLLVAIAAAIACCGPPGSEAPRLVLLYVPCTVNADFLGPYNASVRYTPNLDRFAAESMVFERHQTEAGVTGVAFASILSGTQADRSGIYRHPSELPPEAFLIPEAYARAGYETFAWTDQGMASPRLGYTQGIPAANTVPLPLLATHQRFLRILDRLRSDPDYRAFIFTNFTVTHAPYWEKFLDAFLREYGEGGRGMGPEERRLVALYRGDHLALSWNLPEATERLGLDDAGFARFVEVVEALYAANVNHLDRMFGEVVDAIDERGLADESLVVFTADHGESLYRDNTPFHWSHAMQLASEVIRVPLVIRSRALGTGRYPGVTRSIDLLPTMLSLSGLTAPPDADLPGVDLSGAASGDRPVPKLLAFSHSSLLVRSVRKRMLDERRARNWRELRRFFPHEGADLMWAAVRDEDMLYRLRGRAGEDWRVEAFDLSRDPEERRDLFDPSIPEHAERARQLRAYRERLIEAHGARAAPGSEAAIPESDEVEALRHLGYIE
jgi:arylsulfatase A-like enzyme